MTTVYRSKTTQEPKIERPPQRGTSTSPNRVGAGPPGPGGWQERETAGQDPGRGRRENWKRVNTDLGMGLPG